MKVMLLGEELGSPTSGQSRYLTNLALGLVAEGVHVAVTAHSIRSETRNILQSKGVSVSTLRATRPRPGSKALLLTPWSHIGRGVATLALRSDPADWYIVVADAAIDAIEALPQSRSAFIAQGDLGLMLLSDAFYTSHGSTKSVVALGFARRIRRNAALASMYRLLLGNSEFTRGLMTFLYATPFAGVVYPPVDTDFFHPGETRSTGSPYALSLCRNSDEQGQSVLADVAKHVPLHVVGGARIPHARNLGVVSDELLRDEYRGARLTVVPVTSELFGYAAAESMACGTPVIAFRAGGLTETVGSPDTGWLVDTPTDMVRKTKGIMGTGVPDGMRASARKSAERYSARTSARALIQLLGRE